MNEIDNYGLRQGYWEITKEITDAIYIARGVFLGNEYNGLWLYERNGVVLEKTLWDKGKLLYVVNFKYNNISYLNRNIEKEMNLTSKHIEENYE